MYNVWFGDCFKISYENRHLVIDFGIDSKCLNPSVYILKEKKELDRKAVHKQIADEFADIQAQSINVLITHYHEDHYSGLLYMKNETSYTSPVFGNVYIPNIWELPNSTDVVALLLLEKLLDNFMLSKRGGTLLELVKFLCKNVKNVCLVGRGDLFENGKFQALWPTYDDEYEIPAELKFEDSLWWYNDMKSLAEELCNIVRAIIDKTDHYDFLTYDKRIDELMKRYEGLVKYAQRIDEYLSKEKRENLMTLEII